jgi:hypothetical protein
METQSGGRPTPEEAAAALANADRARSAIRPSGSPRWLLPSLAGLVSVSLAAQALPAPANVAAALVAALLIGVTLGLHINRTGVQYRTNRSTVMKFQVPFVVGVVVVCAGAGMLNVWWAWLVAAVVTGLMFLLLGLYVERQTRNR